MNQPMLIRKLLLGFCLSILGGTTLVLAQEPGVINGTIADENNDPLVGAFITEITTHKSIASDKNGAFSLPVSADKQVILVTSFLGYLNDTTRLAVHSGSTERVSIRLVPLPKMLNEVIVQSRFDRAEALQQINLSSIDHIPLPSGNFESHSYYSGGFITQ